MAPPLLGSRQDNSAIDEWASHDQPLSPYTFSHQPHQLQRSVSHRRSELAQVPELENIGEDPAAFLSRAGLSIPPTLSLTPSPISLSSNSPNRINNSFYDIQTPTTPSDVQSLTTGTTFTGNNMSRQNSLFNEPLVESIQMMKVNSNPSFFTDVNGVDQTLFDQIAPSISSTHTRRSSEEEQSQLLVGAGGAGDSQFPNSFASSEAYFQSSGSFGEKMEKTESNESNTSLSSSSSRSKQRLHAQIAVAHSRRLMPKGGDGNAMSRENSSHSMTRLDSKDGSQDKIAISKPAYQRPKHDRVQCKQCDDYPDGFRGEHELRRHQDRQHKQMVKKWICKIPTNGQDLAKPVQPIVPLTRCKACQQKKKYGAYYNAAAHLRRAHFRPKTKGRSKSGSKLDEKKRGGNGGGNWPSMDELKPWMEEVEEVATEYSLSTTQQDELDASDDEPDITDDTSSAHTMGSIASSFDASYLPDNAFYPSPINNVMFDIQHMQYHLDIPQQSIDTSMCNSQNTFDNFASFQNSHLAFDTSPISSLPLNDQLLGLDSTVNFSYQ